MKILTALSNKKYYLLTAIVAAAIGYSIRPEPKVEIKTVEVESAREEKDNSVTFRKEVRPDGTVITTEERLDRFFKDYWREKRFEKIITPAEPEWIVAVNVAISKDYPKPTYGLTLGYKILPKTYLAGTLWPTEKRVEASLQHLF